LRCRALKLCRTAVLLRCLIYSFRVPAEALALTFNPAAERPALRLKFSRYTLPDSVFSPSSYCAAKFLGSAAHLGRRRILPLLSAFPSIAPKNFRSPFQSGDTINFFSSRVNRILQIHLCKSVHDCEKDVHAGHMFVVTLSEAKDLLFLLGLGAHPRFWRVGLRSYFSSYYHWQPQFKSCIEALFRKTAFCRY